MKTDKIMVSRRLVCLPCMLMLLNACCWPVIAAGEDAPAGAPSALALGLPFADNAILQQGMGGE